MLYLFQLLIQLQDMSKNPLCISRLYKTNLYIIVVQLLSHVQFLVTPWTAAHQASLSVTNSWSLLKLMSMASVMPSNHLILCHPPIPFSSCLQSFPTSGSFPMSRFFTSGGQIIGVSASASVLLMNIQDWFPLGWTGFPCSPRDSQESSPTPQFKSINSRIWKMADDVDQQQTTDTVEEPLDLIRLTSNESAFCIRWPKYWSFSISPSNEYSGLISFRIDWFNLLAVQGTLKSLLQHHSSKASTLQHSAFFMVFVTYWVIIFRMGKCYF